MKIKRSLLSLCTLLTTLMMWAGPVSQEQACEVAWQWLSTQNGAMRRSAAMLPLEVKTVMGATDERQQPLLYAVNIGQQQGYVVVSGDDRLRPVLAYSDKGTYSDERYHLNVVNGFVVNTTTGDKTYAKVTEGTVVTPDNALAVDLTNVSFTDITTNSNPNTLYILSDAQEAPASLTNKNVVKNGVAESISITDDYGFCAPVDFTANSVSYTRTFNKFYDGGQNWSTIVLPFAATQVSNSERTLPWDQAHRRFWLMQFSGESGSALEFTTAPTTLQAHTPYLIALPGDAYGASFSLVGKSKLTFSATNATVKAGTQAATVGTTYKMTGTLLAESGLSYVYILNDVTGTERGNRFVKTTESGSVAPFRAYIEPTSAMPRAQQLSITFGQTTGMGDTLRLNDKGKMTNDSVYDLQGRRVANPTKGIYIVNGKKIIR